MGVLKRFFNSLGLSNRNDQEIGSIEYSTVGWEPREVQPGNKVSIKYHGLLKEAGADRVFLHYASDSWSRPPSTIPMDRDGEGNFIAGIPAEGNHEVNFCFKDSADHWDNNSGWDWILHLNK